MFLCFYGNVLVTSFTVILRPLDYGTATLGNQSLKYVTDGEVYDVSILMMEMVLVSFEDDNENTTYLIDSYIKQEEQFDG
jgi:hypothetical protein